MSDPTKNVFISHIHEDDSDIPKLKDLLNQTGLEIRDGSINSSKPNDAKSPDYIKSGILTPRIEWASVLVVLISPGTHESDWVNWEIEQAHRLDRRIVGVWAHGAKDSDLPENLELFSDAIVGWQGDRIRGAILGKINDSYTASGTRRAPRQISRYSC
jgi:hypothetical protein